MANLLTLAIATAILVMIPGPNVALIVANSIRHGFRMGAMTALGITFGNALQLVAVVAGMAAIIELAAEALTWIRWAGVAYLIYLGIRTWNEPADDLSKVTAAPTMFWRGCMIAAVNPKTLLFIAAFLPQFVVDNGSASGQLSTVAAIFLAVLLLGDMIWAASASSARQLLDRLSGARNRITGGFLVAAGVGLALSRR
ncbi:MAG: LysE family translocator [Gammaproteobacteria bacterium]|nr:LysE family translocator [Gammaproteobacteria bacterium]MDH3804698.1 LysE family translocator [Gammaproteobacteria bacterium]